MVVATPVLATAAPTALWYLTRASGLVALVLLTAVVVLGVLTTRGWSSERWPRFVSQAVHRNLSLFAILLIAVHIVTTVVDGFAPIGYIDGFLPFHSPYRPLWLGLGALAFDLLLVVALTSAIRHRIGYRTWRVVHWLAYASWPVAVLHGLGTGSDTSLGPVLLLNAVCIAAVVGVVCWRLADGWPARAGVRVGAGTAAGAFALAAAVFVAVGPLRPGWAQRAGTPASLLSRASSSTAGASASGTAASGSQGGGAGTSGAGASSAGSSSAGSGSASTGSNGASAPGPFDASLSGALTTSQPNSSDEVTVAIRGQLSGGSDLPFAISLVGRPEDGGVAMSSGQATVGSAQGPVVGLAGDRIVADITSGGTTLQVTFVLRIEQESGTVRGSAQAVSLGSGGGVRG
jgi:sulfoxide reductase heme-binding subunit YedZ